MADNCCIEKCDLFDFMAHFVGMSVLHPGGFAATQKLAEACKVDSNTKVIDIACGKGTTAIYLAEKYGCSVVGVDISEDLIEEAKINVVRKGLTHLISLQVADALALPFNDAAFDVAVSQAMLVLIENKPKAIQEAMRVVKASGTAGWLELSWQKEPTPEFLDIVANEICAYCMLNVSTFEGWENLFRQAGISRLEIIRFANNPQGGFLKMIADEGIANSIRVIFKYLTNLRIRQRMLQIDKFLMQDRECFGYGIYIAKK